ncbi:hypothetical protein [Streptomyces sp. NPDC002530]
MIRLIRTKNLRALQEGAELASVLETDLEKAEAAVAAFRDDQSEDVGQLQKLYGEVHDLRAELAAAESRDSDMHRLVELLLNATKYAFDAADAPGANEIESLLQRLERPAAEQLAEAHELESVRAQRDTAMKDTETVAAALTAESLAHAFHCVAVTEAVTEIAMALSARNPRSAIREVSALLLRHAELFGIDTHGSGTGADTEEKGAVA